MSENKKNNAYEFELIQSKDLFAEAKLFDYKGKIIAVHEKIMNNYEEGIMNSLPFIYDISIDLKEHVPNKDTKLVDAIENLHYVAAKRIDNKKTIKDFQESLVDRNKQSLDKFHHYLCREQNASEYAEINTVDEANGLFLNSVDQGFVSQNLKKTYCNKNIKSIDDVLMSKKI